jgi:hypothetical protein
MNEKETLIKKYFDVWIHNNVDTLEEFLIQ